MMKKFVIFALFILCTVAVQAVPYSVFIPGPSYQYGNYFTYEPIRYLQHDALRYSRYYRPLSYGGYVPFPYTRGYAPFSSGSTVITPSGFHTEKGIIMQTPVQTCYDSDGNTPVKTGYTEVRYPDGRKITVHDFCVGRAYYEGICQGNARSTFVYACSSCSEGVCKDPVLLQYRAPAMKEGFESYD